MNWTELLHIWISDKFALNVEVGPGLIILTAVIAVIIILIKLIKPKGLSFRETELKVALGNIGDIQIRHNHDVAQIAHKAWSELITRKAGLLFDVEHDVIVEVYNSWYQLFSEMRILIKNVPANRLKNKDTKKLVDLLIDSLNKGMRPHLTKWQAKFRRWYDAALEKPENKEKSPQEIQKLYPNYSELLQDLILINQQLVAYTNDIKQLI